jgi:hypothetical protein
MDAQQTLNHVRNLGKIRAAKYYEANKDAINLKRQKPKIQIIPKTKKNELSLNQVQDKIKELNIPNKTTELKYLNDIKRLFQITDSTDLLSILKDSKTIDAINSSVKPNGEPYSVNTQKALYQSILFVIDNLKLDIDKRDYITQFETKKVVSFDQTAAKDDIVPTFKEYINKAKKVFGIGSAEVLIAKFYDVLTLRDDFGLIITDKEIEGNYLLIKPSIEIVINYYKTDKKYGVIRYKLPKALDRETRAFIENHDLQVGDYLFGEKNLSGMVVKMNQELGYTGGVSLFRKMKISELYNTASTEDKVKLAEAMKHSPVIQKTYLRRLI